MRINSIAIVFLLLVAMSSSCEIGSAEKTNISVSGINEFKDIYHKSIFDVLNIGADIYVCKIVNITPNTVASDSLYARGIVKLEIVKTIFGDKTKKNITLPYVYAVGFIKHVTWFPIWPDINSNKDVLLLCVVSKNGYDSQATKHIEEIKLETYEGAASQVSVIKDENDTAVEAIKFICELYTKNDIKLFKEALADKRDEVMRFAQQTLDAKHINNFTHPTRAEDITLEKKEITKERYGGEATDIKYSIKSDKQVYKVGEEIEIQGTIYNDKENQIKFMPLHTLYRLAETRVIFRFGEHGKDKYCLWPKNYLEDLGPGNERQKEIIVKPKSSAEHFRVKLSEYNYELKNDDKSSKTDLREVGVNDINSCRPVSELLRKGKYEIDIGLGCIGGGALPVYGLESNTIEIVIE